MEFGEPSKPYHKILGPFKREMDKDHPHYNKVIPGVWTTPEFEYLQHLDWVWTEKVDGTNIRVHWDGANVSFAGRTDRAQLPPALLKYLHQQFDAWKFEEVFGATPITLYGEGYGGKIQKGINYRNDESFVVFDIKVGSWWLQRFNVEEVADKFGVDVVPQIGLPMSVWDAIEVVKGKATSLVSVTRNDLVIEGMVGTPKVPLFSRSHDRVIMKIKTEDFKA